MRERYYSSYKKGPIHWIQYVKNRNNKRELVHFITNYINAKNYKSVLDIGCGDGLFTYFIKNCNGIDNNPEAIKYGRRYANGKCILFNIHDIVYLPRYDAICMFDVLEHLVDQKQVIEDVALKTNILYILNPTPYGSKYHTTEFTPDELVTFMKGWKAKLIKTFPNKQFFEFHKVGTKSIPVNSL